MAVVPDPSDAADAADQASSTAAPTPAPTAAPAPAPAPAPEPAPAPASSSLLRSIVRTARPKQWTKNVLVFAAPAAAGVLDQGDHLLETLVAFAAFCFAASGAYFLNDASDAEADRLHPTKRDRPVAAGELSVNMARGIGIGLIVASLLIAAPINDGKLTGVIAAYLAVTVAYSLWLKHEAVIDLAAVAAGFVFRAIAGGVATNVQLSDWFLIVAGAGSLFMVTGKRHAEQIELGSASHGHRATLAEYSDAYLRYVRAVASGVMLTAYCLWAFENASATGDTTWFRLSIVPFVLAVLRYALVIEQGGGGAPEEVVLSDRVLQVLGLIWVVTFALGVNG
ncbi:MAG: decaprenyl-phosphate phosphoribosyltransferase [Acidimicrobiia bacterium]